jgi:hypothetical protein
MWLELSEFKSERKFLYCSGGEGNPEFSFASISDFLPELDLSV